MTLQTVVVEQTIKAAPDRVWQRIATPEGLASWWRPGNIAPVVGHEFAMDMGKWGQTPCRVTAVDPCRMISYTFSDFELYWEIIPNGAETILRLEHRGFDLSNPQHQFTFNNMGPGWKDMVLPRLAESLADAA